MRQALTAPLFGTILLAGLAFGANVYQRDTPHAVTHRLALHAPIEPDAVYLTAWQHGAIQHTFVKGNLEPITFTIRGRVFDACEVLAIETLVPLDDKMFSYDYRETILSCDADAPPLRKTPRQGIVTVED